MGKANIFDRFIDIDLITGDGTIVSIKTPSVGMKPNISMKGAFAANIVYDATISLYNFYSPYPLNADVSEGGSTYKWIRVLAGYRGAKSIPIEGQIFTGFQPSPGPDGVTEFTFLTGVFDVLVENEYSGYWISGTSINRILRDMCTKISTPLISIALESTLSEDLVCEAPVHCSGRINDFLEKLKAAYNISILPDGQKLKVCSADLTKGGSGIIHELNYVTSVKKSAAGLTITAPWNPAVRPNDTVRIDSKYYALENYGGTFVNFGTDFIVINENFSFDTVGSANQMILLTVAKE